eukprot:jgi/Mesen1/4573/ME000232S03830
MAAHSFKSLPAVCTLSNLGDFVGFGSSTRNQKQITECSLPRQSLHGVLKCARDDTSQTGRCDRLQAKVKCQLNECPGQFGELHTESGFPSNISCSSKASGQTSAELLLTRSQASPRKKDRLGENDFHFGNPGGIDERGNTDWGNMWEDRADIKASLEEGALLAIRQAEESYRQAFDQMRKAHTRLESAKAIVAELQAGSEGGELQELEEFAALQSGHGVQLEDFEASGLDKEHVQDVVAMEEARQNVSRIAFEKAEKILKKRLSEAQVQSRVIDHHIELLDRGGQYQVANWVVDEVAGVCYDDDEHTSFVVPNVELALRDTEAVRFLQHLPYDEVLRIRVQVPASTPRVLPDPSRYFDIDVEEGTPKVVDAGTRAYLRELPFDEVTTPGWSDGPASPLFSQSKGRQELEDGLCRTSGQRSASGGGSTSDSDVDGGLPSDSGEWYRDMGGSSLAEEVVPSCPRITSLSHRLFVDNKCLPSSSSASSTSTSTSTSTSASAASASPSASASTTCSSDDQEAGASVAAGSPQIRAVSVPYYSSPQLSWAPAGWRPSEAVLLQFPYVASDISSHPGMPPGVGPVVDVEYEVDIVEDSESESSRLQQGRVAKRSSLSRGTQVKLLALCCLCGALTGVMVWRSEAAVLAKDVYGILLATVFAGIAASIVGVVPPLFPGLASRYSAVSRHSRHEVASSGNGRPWAQVILSLGLMAATLSASTLLAFIVKGVYTGLAALAEGVVGKVSHIVGGRAMASLSSQPFALSMGVLVAGEVLWTSTPHLLTAAAWGLFILSVAISLASVSLILISFTGRSNSAPVSLQETAAPAAPAPAS